MPKRGDLQQKLLDLLQESGGNASSEKVTETIGSVDRGTLQNALARIDALPLPNGIATWEWLYEIVGQILDQSDSGLSKEELYQLLESSGILPEKGYLSGLTRWLNKTYPKIDGRYVCHAEETSSAVSEEGEEVPEEVIAFLRELVGEFYYDFELRAADAMKSEFARRFAQKIGLEVGRLLALHGQMLLDSVDLGANTGIVTIEMHGSKKRIIFKDAVYIAVFFKEGDEK